MHFQNHTSNNDKTNYFLYLWIKEIRIMICENSNLCKNFDKILKI